MRKPSVPKTRNKRPIRDLGVEVPYKSKVNTDMQKGDRFYHKETDSPRPGKGLLK